MTDTEAAARLRRELDGLRKDRPWSKQSICKSEAVEMACARLGLSPNYGKRLLGITGPKPMQFAAGRTWDLKRRAG